MRVSELHVIATAAIRDTDDGKSFVKEMERAHGIDIRIISGKKEAQYAAYGIFSSHFQPHGLVGDLGGGSLELVSLEDQDIDTRATLPLGPLRLIEKDIDNRTLIHDTTQQQLNQLDWLNEQSFECFYAVGGGFRALAKIHMKEQDYPLDLLDHYRVSREEILPFLDRIAHAEGDALDDLAVSSKRRALMPASAMVMKEVVERSNAKQVVFSTSGIREGLLYGLLSPYLQKEDPLISSAMEMAEGRARTLRYALDLYEWMAPLFAEEDEAHARLRLAACIMNEVSWNIYRPSRAEWAYHAVLHASLAAIGHEERVSLAAAMYHRYKPKWKEDWPSYRILSKKQRQWAVLIGTAMRLGFYLSGSVPGNLKLSSLKIDRGKPKLRLSKETQPLQGDPLDSRFDDLVDAYKG